MSLRNNRIQNSKRKQIKLAKQFLPGRNETNNSEARQSSSDKNPITCPFCEQAKFIRKHGLGSAGKPLFKCVNCSHLFHYQNTN